MGKRTRLREAQQSADELALAALLRFHKKSHPRIQHTTWRDFPDHMIARMHDYGAFAIRDPADWHGPPKSEPIEERYLDLIRYTFGRYPAPAHLERAWLDESDVPKVPDFRHWHILATQGRTLHPLCSALLLTRAETHQFLMAPSVVRNPTAALWYAMGHSTAPSPRGAIKITRSRIVAQPLGDAYWKDVAQFLSRHPLTLDEMNEIIAFAAAIQQDDPLFSLRGRSLASVQRRIADWKAMSGLAPLQWTGSRLPNASYEVPGATWHFRQLKSTLRLFEEGRRMSHCVVGYAENCYGGATTIWSLTCERDGRARRHLTVEVDHEGTIWQVRGFANRMATLEEAEVLCRWAAEHGLTWFGDTVERAQAAE